MKVLNTEFSEKGLESFTKLSRKEQKKVIKKYNPLSLPKEIDKALKGVKYGKSTRVKKEVSESNGEQTSKQSKGDSNERSDDNRSQAK